MAVTLIDTGKLRCITSEEISNILHSMPHCSIPCAAQSSFADENVQPCLYQRLLP